MTSFTTEDRLAAEREAVRDFELLIQRIYKLSVTVDDPELALELKLMADRLASTNDRYHRLADD